MNPSSVRLTRIGLVSALWLLVGFDRTHSADAQISDGPLQIFGYYQNAAQYYARVGESDSNTFLLQQLNFIAQKDLGPKFRSFVNFEFLNTFESSLRWGSASLKEAWVRYDGSPGLRLKIGLQLPVFNHLNEIKSRTPLLPYIVRPVAYETSLKEIIDVEEYTPERAFLQAYGTTPGSRLSFDYAAYLGNTRNINNDQDRGQTGIDTTAIIMVGGRLGLHMNNMDSDLSEVRFGISATHDRINLYEEIIDLIPPNDPTEKFNSILKKMPRWRLGADLGLYWNQFYLQSEAIIVRYLETSEDALLERSFFYSTLGYTLSERSEMYLSYWQVQEHGYLNDERPEFFFLFDQEVNLDIYSVGARYNLTPRLVLKGQYAFVNLDSIDIVRDMRISADSIIDFGEKFSIITIALSVFF
jgi:hypothetical protein